MTISNTAVKVLVACDGVTTTFNYGFYIDKQADATLYLIDSAGNYTTLSSSAWSGTGFGNASGGTFTYPLAGSPVAAGNSLLLLRNIPYTQLSNLSNQGAYYPGAVEGALDWLAAQTQQLREMLARAILAPAAENSLSALPTVAQRANLYLAFNGSGQPIAVAGSVPGSVTVSAFGALLIQQATAAAARAVLGSTVVGDALFITGSAAAARTTLGSTAVGDALFTAASAAAARTTLGATATGDALFTAVTALSARTTLDVYNKAEVQAGAYIFGGTSGGAANAQTITPSPAILALSAGMQFIFTAGFTNTGAMTLAANGFGAAVKTPFGTDPQAGYVVQNLPYVATYTGSNWLVQPIAFDTKVLVYRNAALSGVSQLDILLDTVCRWYEIDAEVFVSSASAILTLRTSTNGGVSYDSGGADYVSTNVYFNGTSAAFTGAAAAASSAFTFAFGADNAAASEAHLMNRLIPGDGTHYPRLVLQEQGAMSTGVAFQGIGWGTGVRVSATRVNAMRIGISAGTFGGALSVRGVI